jgi:hypothetical protein
MGGVWSKQNCAPSWIYLQDDANTFPYSQIRHFVMLLLLTVENHKMWNCNIVQ